MHRSRLDCSAVVRSTGFITWATKRRLRLRSSFNMTPASFSPTCRCCSNWSLPSIEHRRRSCGSRSVGGRFRRMLCSMWCRRTWFVGRHIIWRLWACGGHLLLRTFGKPCRRRHAMLACRAMTVSRIGHSEIRWCWLNSYSYIADIVDCLLDVLSCVYIVCLHSM